MNFQLIFICISLELCPTNLSDVFYFNFLIANTRKAHVDMFYKSNLITIKKHFLKMNKNISVVLTIKIPFKNSTRLIYLGTFYIDLLI